MDIEFSLPPEAPIRPRFSFDPKRLLRGLKWLLLAVCLLCAVLFAVARFWLPPWLNENREWIAAELSKTSGVPVSIEGLQASWAGWRPSLRLSGLAINDGEQAGLRLEQVEATLAWSSLLYGVPHFNSLEIVGPQIGLGRDKDGVFTVAGMRIEPRTDTDGKRNDPLAWLLAQSRVDVSGAVVVWNDELRAAPPLRLTEVQFRLERGLIGHTFELRARPPAALATVLEAKGEVNRYDPASLDKTDGNAHISLERADLGGWAAWVDDPFALKGNGGVRLWLDSDGAGTVSLNADVTLSRAEATLASGLPTLKLNRLGGRLQYSRAPGGTTVGARGLWAEVADSPGADLIDFSLEWRQEGEQPVSGGAFSAAQLDLTRLVQLAGYLPLDDKVRGLLAEYDPKGRLRDVAFAWEGAAAAPTAWTLNAKFDDLGLVARGIVPGMSGVSGTISGNREEGVYTLSGRDGWIELPAVFEESHIPLASLAARGGWAHSGGRLKIRLDALDFANADAAGSVAGSYWPADADAGPGPGDIDLKGKLSRADAAAVWRYIPRIAGPHAFNWVKGAIKQGKVSDVDVLLRGPLRRFPFRRREGEFVVTLQAHEGRLDYAAGWPGLEDIEGQLRFEGPGMFIDARQARIFGAKVTPLHVEIPDLHVGVLALEGVANGPSADFLRFIAASPLPERLRDFTSSWRAEAGNGQLDLNLTIPFHELHATQVGGTYRFAANRLRLGEGWPALEAVEGAVGFTGDKITFVSPVRGRLFGAPFTLEGQSGAEGLELSARGGLHADAAYQSLGQPWLASLEGSTDWQARMVFGPDTGRVSVQSWLRGLRSRLPEPFGKESNDAWPLELVVTSSGPARSRQVTAKIAGWFDAALECDASGAWRGGIGVNRSVVPARKGIAVAAALQELDVDGWRRALDGNDAMPEDGTAALPLASVVLDARRVWAFGHLFNTLTLRVQSDDEGWRAHLESPEALGEVMWRHASDGKLSARLRRLILSSEVREAANGGNGDDVSPQRLPALDIRAERFVIGKGELGQLEVAAVNQGGGWRLDNLSIQQPGSRFTGSGLWQPGKRHSQLNFTLVSEDAGKLIQAMGYPDMLQGGQTKLAGELDWQGPPVRIDYPSLSGALELDARNGRFARIQPGVGRLLGILSLQALPRRITLDFRDVFSEGFAFDRLAGKVTVAGGVVRTDEGGIEIAGPAAKVKMRGQANIADETQDLQVNVQPTLSESVAIGAAVANPVAGAVTYLAQKVLGDPIEKLFSYDYKITGNWIEPVVEKVGSAN
ncbi:MAG: TIGR02099 family protein [Azoarcus sp.]|nr:TIGR02099 family protein [Azoarcus sp.]